MIYEYREQLYDRIDQAETENVFFETADKDFVDELGSDISIGDSIVVVRISESGKNVDIFLTKSNWNGYCFAKPTNRD